MNRTDHPTSLRRARVACCWALALAMPGFAQSEAGKQATPQQPQGQQPPQGQQAPDPAAAGRATADAMLQQFAAEKIELDLAHGTLTVPAVVNAPPDPIEYLLIHRKGKRHEAMFYTASKPSVLNAGLLLLGLQPGKNASYKDREPAPTLEEIEKGADPVVVTPPQGMEFWMTVAWHDDNGDHDYCVEDLLADLTTQEPVRDASWIYLGGRLARLYKDEPEVFVADFEGNLVSVCYLTPDNHLGTMRHARARDDENWWLTDKVPPPGTEVRFTFHKQKSKLHLERERRLAREDAAKAAGEKPADQSTADKPAGDKPPTKDGGR